MSVTQILRPTNYLTELFKSHNKFISINLKIVVILQLLIQLIKIMESILTD